MTTDALPATPSRAHRRAWGPSQVGHTRPQAAASARHRGREALPSGRASPQRRALQRKTMAKP